VFVNDPGAYAKRQDIPGPLANFLYRGWISQSFNSFPVQNPNTVPYTSPFPVASFTGSQYTETSNNRVAGSIKLGGSQDIGSEFFTQKQYVVKNLLPYVRLLGETQFFDDENFPPLWSYTVTTEARGQLFMPNCFQCYPLTHPNPNLAGKPVLFGNKYWKPNFPPDLSSSREVLEEIGTNIVASISPGKPIVKLSVTLGEALQRLPSIPGVASWERHLGPLRRIKRTSEEWLNFWFAVKPTIADIQKSMNAYLAFDRAISQFERDSGKIIRRKFDLDTVEEVVDITIPQFSPAGHAADLAYSSYPYYRSMHFETKCTRTIRRDQKFSGAFTYFLPDWYSFDRESRTRLAQKIVYGTDIDLVTLWNLAPWSWLVDWVTNAGSYIANLQRYLDYGTILRRGYMMEHCSVSDTYSYGPRLPQYWSNELAIAKTSITLVNEVKKRVRAGPFNFGVTWDGLDPFQLSILAALGITRAVK
jgi:hypothetical protein